MTFLNRAARRKRKGQQGDAAVATFTDRIALIAACHLIALLLQEDETPTTGITDETRERARTFLRETESYRTGSSS